MDSSACIPLGARLIFSYIKHIYVLHMKLADRHLCFDFLIKVTGRSRGEAQQFFFTRGKADRARLLNDATDWRLASSPVRDPVSLMEVTSSEPESPEPLVVDVLKSGRPAKAKKVMYSILLPPPDLEALKDLANEDGETVSFHIRQAIRAYLRSHKIG